MYFFKYILNYFFLIHDNMKEKISLMQQVLDKMSDTKHSKADVKELEDLVKVPKTEKGDNVPHTQIFKEGYQQQIDLLHLPMAPFGYRYLLTVVDLHSKLLDGEQLKGKEPKQIVTAIKKIYERKILQIPRKIVADNGSEFNGVFETYCEDNSIILRKTEVNRHRQNSIVEAANKKVGLILIKLLSLDETKSKKLEKNWVKYLRDVIDVLNKNRKKPITTEISETPIITKENHNILSVGQHVRTLLNYSSDITGKKMLGVRGGDVRFSNVKTISQIVLKAGLPPLYEVDHEPNTLYTIQQLQIIKPMVV